MLIVTYQKDVFLHEQILISKYASILRALLHLQSDVLGFRIK